MCKIKALKWEKESIDIENPMPITAYTMFGSYDIYHPFTGGGYEVDADVFILDYCFCEYHNEGQVGSYSTLDEAKAAANAHWISLINECLEHDKLD